MYTESVFSGLQDFVPRLFHKISGEEVEESLHLYVEGLRTFRRAPAWRAMGYLFGVQVLDRTYELVQLISHSLGMYTAGGRFEVLIVVWCTGW